MLFDHMDRSYNVQQEISRSCLQNAQDLSKSDCLMRGVIALLSCNFRLTLPVILKRRIMDELKACFKSSILWKHIKVLKVSRNMSAHFHGDHLSKQFNNFATSRKMVRYQAALNLSKICTLVRLVEEIIEKIFKV